MDNVLHGHMVPGARSLVRWTEICFRFLASEDPLSGVYGTLDFFFCSESVLGSIVLACSDIVAWC